MLFTILVVLIALIALLMIGLILLQSGKGGGLAGIAAGGTQQVLGARQAPDLLEKATWVLGGVFLVLCLLTSFAIEGPEAPSSIIQEEAGSQPTQSAPAAPALPQDNAQPQGAETPATPPAGENGQ